MRFYSFIEKNIGVMSALMIVAISFGTLVELVPMFFQPEITEPIQGLKPYSPLELEGRDVYIKEGCVGCHSQMIRPLRAEVERYGHYSVAGESVYDHPFLWGSKRTGPDLARVGNRYSDEWHRAHLMNPRDVVPQSIMPAYPHLAKNILDAKVTKDKMQALQMIGVPYSDEDIAKAEAEVKGRSELDALIIYLQSLGILLRGAQ
jgi:cytochrome c oxidase cbb3-type subunit 2